MNELSNQNIFPLITKNNIDISNLKVISKYCDFEINLKFEKKCLILEKLLEAQLLAKTNVLAGNITKRGFATNVCTNDGFWSLGTNFNNTRNDISSICGERSAILKAYNEALFRFAKDETKKEFNFKIKYLCMSSDSELDEIFDFIIPCEDCLSWLNTNRYFSEDTLIFSLERDEKKVLKIVSTRLIDLLPYKNLKTSNIFDFDKKKGKVNITNAAADSIRKYNISDDKIDELINKTIEAYNNNNFAKISNQNIAVSILSKDKIYTTSKLDWTKRWHVEPLEYCVYNAVTSQKEDVKINAICYFGDEYSNNKFDDGVVSVKSLGRIRQKYALKDTILILNLEDEILITTIGEYLPRKFIQGYKIQ